MMQQQLAQTVLSPFEAVGNTMKSFVSGLIGGETNKELIKEIKGNFVGKK